MKIILSRKGFDSANGGIVSPIMADGAMLPFPIPSKDDTTFDSLCYGGLRYSELLRDLNYRGGAQCHIDPDLSQERRVERIDGWVPAFGQINAAATYLKNIGVKPGDIFLFFGNFRFAERWCGRYRYCRNSADPYRGRDLQVIWGYLQVGEILTAPDAQRKLYWHPHASAARTANPTNTIFKALSMARPNTMKPLIMASGLNLRPAAKAPQMMMSGTRFSPIWEKLRANW